MKTVATALLTGAADNSGYIPSSPKPRGRWPTVCHQYFGIRTDLDATKWGEAGQINPFAYSAEVMRPVHLDYMREAKQPKGIWLANNYLISRGSSAPGTPGKPLVSVVALSRTPLVSMSSEDNGLGTLGDKIHPSALEQGFEGETHHSNPAPLRKDRMLYAMCDGSVQVMPDFWPYREPEPWRYFHPLGRDAPASEVP